MAFLKRKLFAFALAYGAGVLIGHFTGLSPVVLLIIGALCGVFAVIARVAGKRALALGVLCALIFCGGAAYLRFRETARPAGDEARDVEFSGRIGAYPYIDTDGERFVCKLSDVTLDGAQLGYDVRLYLRGGKTKLDKLMPGQRVSGAGKLRVGEAPTNPGEFDFGKYLWRNGMGGYVTAQYSKAEISGDGGSVAAWLYRARNATGAKIDELYGDNADIIRALILGDSSELSADMREAFSTAGVAHLLAISGLHIMLAAFALQFALKWLVGARVATIITILLITAYAVFLGQRASVWRAVIMFSIMQLAPFTGRPSDSPTRLAAAFLALLLVNPLDIFDVGFILSFSASAGLILLMIPVKHLMRLSGFGAKQGVFNTVVKYFVGVLSATLVAQIATMPAVAIFYNKLPALSALSNVIIIPFTLILLLLAFISVPCAMIFSPLGAIAELPNAMVTILKIAVERVSNMPMGNVSLPDLPWWACAAFFVIAILTSSLSRIPLKRRAWFAPALMVVMIIGVAFSYTGCELVFLDVGQGDAAVARAGGGVIVVDVGTDGTQVVDYIENMGYDIDALILSHPHDDHAGGLRYVLESCPPRAIYVPVGWFECTGNIEIMEASALALNMGIPIEELASGDVLLLANGARVDIISPERGVAYSENDMSLVFTYSYGEADALFTGDATMKYSEDIDILKVSHHGANSSNREDFIARADPEIAVISVGKNSYGHPGDKVMDSLTLAGAEILRTDERGAIIIELTKGGDMNAYGFCD